MSEERETYPRKNIAWTEKSKERSLYSDRFADRPIKYVRPPPHRLGAIHKRLGKKIESNDDQTDEKCGIIMQQLNHSPTDGGGARNPFRSVGNTYRSVATITTPESVASQSTDERDPLQMIKVKVEMSTPLKSTGQHHGNGNADAGQSHSSNSSGNKRTRDSEHDMEESESQSDDVTVIQTPVKRQKIDDTSIDLGESIILSFIFPNA